MTIPFNKIQVRVHLENIRHNYRLLNAVSGKAMPVIKADAYGHGLIEVGRALAEEGADTFAVGTVEEAVALRTAGTNGIDGTIIALLGPIDEWEYPAMAEHAILPFIGNFTQLDKTMDALAGKPLDICLKFDTGMARLGFTQALLPELLARLAKTPNIRPVLAASHLATADEPDKWTFRDEQAGRFAAILDGLRRAGHEVEATLANSAAILDGQNLHHHRQRAGIALYGANPYKGTDLEDVGAALRPGMDVTAPVLEVHDLPKGTPISYGCTFTADKDMRVAILAAGYADAYSRSLSNRGQVCLHGVRAPILGRVCMQLTAIDVGAVEKVTGNPVAVGERAHLLGGDGTAAITSEELAEWWSTIPYEVFCLLGLNQRTYT